MLICAHNESCLVWSCEFTANQSRRSAVVHLSDKDHAGDTILRLPAPDANAVQGQTAHCQLYCQSLFTLTQTCRYRPQWLSLSAESVWKRQKNHFKSRDKVFSSSFSLIFASVTTRRLATRRRDETQVRKHARRCRRGAAAGGTTFISVIEYFGWVLLRNVLPSNCRQCWHEWHS